MQLARTYKIAFAVLGALAALGAGAYAFQLASGVDATGLSNGVSWGLYIICFMFFGGVSAGSLIVASAASVFKFEAYRRIALPAVLLSLVSMCVAGAFVLADLGGIARVPNLLASPNLASPLLWDIGAITLVLVLDAVYAYCLASKRASPSAAHVVARVALPAAVLVLSVEAWIFGLQIAREGWHSAIMAPLFVASGLDSGLAALLLALVWMNRHRMLEAPRRLVASLAGILAAFVAVDGYLVGCEVLTMVYPGAAQGSAVFAELTSGSMAPFFWTEIVAGVLVPFGILAFSANRRRAGLVVLACAGVVVGVFCKRVWLLLASFAYPNVYGAPGLISGSSSAQGLFGMDGWSTVGSYAPAPLEVLVAVGLIALGSLAFLVLVRLLVRPDEKRDPREAPPGSQTGRDGAACAVEGGCAPSGSCRVAEGEEAVLPVSSVEGAR